MKILKAIIKSHTFIIILKLRNYQMTLGRRLIFMEYQLMQFKSEKEQTNINLAMMQNQATFFFISFFFSCTLYTYYVNIIL